MYELARHFRGLGIPQAASPFEGLVLSILGQQISNEVARVLRDLLVDTLGGSISAGGVDYRVFPSPMAIAEAGTDASGDQIQREEGRVHSRHLRECGFWRPRLGRVG